MVCFNYLVIKKGNAVEKNIALIDSFAALLEDTCTESWAFVNRMIYMPFHVQTRRGWVQAKIHWDHGDWWHHWPMCLLTSTDHPYVESTPPRQAPSFLGLLEPQSEGPPGFISIFCFYFFAGETSDLQGPNAVATRVLISPQWPYSWETSIIWRTPYRSSGLFWGMT